jgi:outer membrane protein
LNNSRNLPGLCGVLLGLTGATLYPTLAAAADFRLGVVNPIKVLEAAPQAEDARKRLEREFQPRDKTIVAAQKKVKSLEDKLSKEGPGMGESDRRTLERNLINEKRELKRDQDEFREDFTVRRNEEFGKIQRQVVEAIQSFAKEEGFDIIVGEGVVYANDKVDVTAKVVERLKRGGKGK